MLENMYHNMTYDELARETMRSDCKLAKAVLEKCNETLEISRSSDLLQVQKDFVKNETPKNRGTLDPKGWKNLPPLQKGVHKMYTPYKSMIT